MRSIKRLVSRAMLGTLILTSHQAFSEDLGPSLTKINTSGVIAVGHREASIPFSYYDSQQNVVGFSQDLCQKVIQAVKTKLGKPNLMVRMVPVNSQNRIALLQNGTIDIECGVTTNTKARHSQVAFSDTVFLALTRLLVNKDSGIKDFGDLSNKTVVTNAGTTAETIIRHMNVDKKLGMNIISAKDYGESFLTLESGRARAFMLDDVLLSGARTLSRKPDDWIVTGTAQSREPYAFMVRKDDPIFKTLVDQTLSGVMTSGEINAIYAKWFLKPVPPKGINFNFAMTPQLREIYAHPNDQADY
ncbi:amino acid ABC transporter substrate-binding protein [Pandoraea capi]|nr:amino acid ABC transporter substrate-binding protein [Pandoraea sp. LA3]MDN4586077.1 amino acid ABC transporter substrate-binding protein [Pandoraea capi]